MTRPLVTVSLGLPGVFLLGGTTREEKPVPILLRSGDVLIMSGFARLCYHGLPTILHEDDQQQLCGASEASSGEPPEAGQPPHEREFSFPEGVLPTKENPRAEHDDAEEDWRRFYGTKSHGDEPDSAGTLSGTEPHHDLTQGQLEDLFGKVRINISLRQVSDFTLDKAALSKMESELRGR